MVVLAASICTKGGKAVISRQFRDMTRTRIESLLASFPKLIPTNTQHTTVETADVRYVYQPLEDLYIVLITNKTSNILLDIDTLHLFARVVSDLCRTADEREILSKAFEILGAFDEVVSLGYREQVNLMQVRSVLEMESHEEKIQEIIARNKEAEAKEELKRRAKHLEMQRREQQRRAAAGGAGSSYLGGGVSGYSPVPRYEAPDPSPPRITTSSPAPSVARAPAFKGSGMKLGSKKTKQAELLDALGGDMLQAATPAVTEMSAPPTPSAIHEPTSHGNNGRGSLPEVEAESVHAVIKEQLSLSLLRDGGVQAMELKGEMNLQITDSNCANVRLTLATPSTDFGGNSLQFKQHPNVAKFVPGQQRVVALKDPSRSFPVGQSLAVLKWRYAGTDETSVPLSINCWPTPSNDGTCEVSIEYELENEDITLYDLVISIPLPDGSYPAVSSHSGEWSLNPSSHSLAWTIPLVSASDDTRSGSLIFSVGGDDVGTFFPVDVTFIGKGSLAGVDVVSVAQVAGGEAMLFSVDSLLTIDEYLVV
ncbi:coatomer subunit delta [Moniliophthora roreri MCA 2997]|uniref:Coatomer subunit delta n=1 Tax=Moniliophthora roreri (strain MCA 2997) TaxID=1381753 RepID=V2X7D1_MONRO|nr:coatomer subunit delta [Moniliophthora roreri MCA 2997]